MPQDTSTDPRAPGEPDGRPTLLVVVAHPDDETFGCGGAIAHAAAAGARIVVCSATAGEKGEDHSEGPAATLGARRTAELADAGAILGVERTVVLGFGDSDWDGDPPPGSLCALPVGDVAAAIAVLVDEVNPDVVVTMDPTGSDGHRDHARIGEATTLAVGANLDTHPDIRLYHWFLTRSLMGRWAEHMASLDPDSVYLDLEMGRPDEDATTVLATDDQIERLRRAMAAHATQTSPYAGLPTELEEAFLARSHLQRVIPAWPGGPPETSLT